MNDKIIVIIFDVGSNLILVKGFLVNVICEVEGVLDFEIIWLKNGN